MLTCLCPFICRCMRRLSSGGGISPECDRVLQDAVNHLRNKLPSNITLGRVHRLEPRAGSGGICRTCTTAIRTGGYVCSQCRCEWHYKCAQQGVHPLCSQRFLEGCARHAHLYLFVSLLRSYRNFLAVLPEDSIAARAVLDDESAWFDKQGFLQSLDKESRPFVSELMQSQAWSQFTLERLVRPKTDFEVLFFDSLILEKLNRGASAMMAREATPFLMDSSYHISSHYVVRVPLTDLSEGSAWGHAGIPPIWNTDTIQAPDAPALADEAALVGLRTHTHAAARRVQMLRAKQRRLGGAMARLHAVTADMMQFNILMEQVRVLARS
jgi:hypothetical protein